LLGIGWRAVADGLDDASVVEPIWRVRKTRWFWVVLCDSISPELIGIWIMKQAGFFDVEERLARLSGLGDQLEAFSRTVDF